MCEIWVQLIEGVVLVLGYLWLLYHVRTGNKNKWLTWVTVMLLLANVGVIMTWYGAYLIFLQGKRTALLTVELGAGVASKYVWFTTSHFLLAEKYAAMARKVPATLDNKPEDPPTRCRENTYSISLALNIIAPIIQGVGVGFLRYKGLVLNEQPPSWVAQLLTGSYIVSGIMMTISGVILIVSVIKIRNYFKSKGCEDYINTGMLLRHALSFGLYLLGTIIFYVVFCLYAF